MPNPQGYTLRDVLAIENDAALLEFKCAATGIVLWPFVRTTFIRMILSDLLYGRPIGPAQGRSTVSGQSLATLGRSAVWNALHGKRWTSDVCLMSSALGHIVRDGEIFDRLADHFALALPGRSVVWEDRNDWRWPFPRTFDHVLFHAPVAACGGLLGRVLVNRAHRVTATALIDLVTARAKQSLGWVPDPERRSRLIELLARKIPQIDPLYAYYRRVLRSRQVRLLIKEDASYGPSAILMAAARSIGIVTAEYQHGAVSAGHDAYNIASALQVSAAYDRAMPEYFLGYGEWWNSQIDTPKKRIAIGNPHRSEIIKRMGSDIDGDAAKVSILVLGDGIETEYYLNFVRSLVPVARRMGLRLVFRPHPLERARVQSDTGGDFEIDINADIYASLRTAHAVVSEMSTGLFEAVGLADRVLIWETEKAKFTFPEHCFETFADTEELVAVLERPATPSMSREENVTRTWAPGWRDNYLNFVDMAMSATNGIHT